MNTSGPDRIARAAGSAGPFRTDVFERYQRSEKAPVAAMLEMYVQGMSTRKVKTNTEDLHAATHKPVARCVLPVPGSPTNTSGSAP